MFRSFILAVTYLFIGVPQAAQASWWCEDLWFTRNAILDRAGMCFESVLGQTVFGNEGCTGTSVSLAPGFAPLVNQLSDLERQAGCRIDTSQPVLNLPDLAIRQRMEELPVPSPEGGYNCIGWRGPPITLFAARSVQSLPLGRIEPGDFVGMWETPWADWSYIVTHAQSGGPLKTGGWMQGGWDPNEFCAEQAG
ncbi:MAG: DUF4453 domain-containing protein [Dinoroseobacter sp.]|nr:DUF4453 domain-containing protein [Dinoroseobacter sp.]